MVFPEQHTYVSGFPELGGDNDESNGNVILAEFIIFYKCCRLSGLFWSQLESLEEEST